MDTADVYALAVLRHNRDGISDWVVPRCPYCGKQHVHSAGRQGVDDPRAELGPRASHCIADTGSASRPYVLIEAES